MYIFRVRRIEIIESQINFFIYDKITFSYQINICMDEN